MSGKSFQNTAVLLWAILAFLVAIALVPLAYACFGSKQQLADWIINALNRPDLLPIIIEKLQPDMLVLLSVLLVLVLLLFLIFFVYLFPLSNHRLQKFIGLFYHSLKKEWQYFNGLAKSVKWLLALLVLFYLITRLYMIVTVPLERDESMSYYYFIKPGPLVAMSYYPYPNNHPLYSLLAWPFSKLPVVLVWKIRLPVLLLGLACVWLAYRLLEKLIPNRFAAVAGALMLTCLFPFGRFSVYGRGYLLQLLIALLILLYYQRSLSRNESPPLKLLTVFYVLGFYTMPTFLYFATIALPIFGVVFWQRKLITPVNYARHLFMIGLLTGLLYLPYVITNSGWQGFKAVVYSGYSLTEVWTIADSWRQGLRGWNIFLLRPREEWTAYFVLGVASIGLFGLKKIRKQYWLLLFALLLLWLPMLAHLAQRHYIPERAFTNAIIILPAGLLDFAFCLKPKYLRVTWWAGLSLVFAINYCLYFLAPNYPFGQERTLDASAAIFAEKLLQQNADTIYLHDGWYRPVIEATYHEAGKPLVIYLNSSESPNYRAYDSTTHYDAVIFRSHTVLAIPEKYTWKIGRPDAFLYGY